MPKLSDTEFIKAVGAQLNRTGTAVRLPQHAPVVVGHVDATSITGFGNQPVGSRFFSRREDVAGHMHRPGTYYCGRCLLQVVVA